MSLIHPRSALHVAGLQGWAGLRCGAGGGHGGSCAIVYGLVQKSGKI